MRTTFTRRQFEISAAAMLAAITAIIGIAGRDEEKRGPRFLVLEKIEAPLDRPPGQEAGQLASPR